jgi:hypothetical protein
MKQFSILLCVVAIIGFSTPAFSITITAMDSAEGLAESLVGTGITISNISFTGANVAAGYFEGGNAAGIGIEKGVVLTSGFASNLNGTTNTVDGITGNNGVAGDSDLNALIPGYSTNDATVLSFDFVSQGDAAYFNYVFGSEEYNEYVGSNFNDVFGFFVDDVNYALIPDTDTAVSINNVNNNSNSSYYNDNDKSDLGDPTPFAFEYDGFTDVLMASITGLTAGETYNIKLAIADAGDYVLDSGVFIQAGSFSDKPTIPEPATMLLLGSGLLGLAIFGRKKRIIS